MEARSALAKLFDFSFREFLTLHIVRYLYMLNVGIAALVALGTALGGVAMMGSSFFQGLLTVLVAPVVFLLMTLLARIFLEAVVATFRIAENTTRMADRGELGPPGP